MYLFKLQNVCVQIAKCIYPNCQMYLSKLPLNFQKKKKMRNVFVKIAKCNCPNLPNVFVQFSKCICPIFQMYVYKSAEEQGCRGPVQWKMEHRESIVDIEDMGEQIEREEDGWVAIGTLLILSLISSKLFRSSGSVSPSPSSIGSDVPSSIGSEEQPSPQRVHRYIEGGDLLWPLVSYSLAALVAPYLLPL